MSCGDAATGFKVTEESTEHDSGRRIRGSQQDPHICAWHYGPEETAPSKTDLNKQIY